MACDLTAITHRLLINMCVYMCMHVYECMQTCEYTVLARGSSVNSPIISADTVLSVYSGVAYILSHPPITAKLHVRTYASYRPG